MTTPCVGAEELRRYTDNMAIPFSLPASATTSGRNHRESLAKTTGISGGDVSFSDLSLSSQLLYLAMVEALRVVQDIAQEVADQDYDDEYSNYVHSDDQDEPDCRILPKNNKDEDDKKFEECPKYEDFIVAISPIGDHESVESEEDSINYAEKTERRHDGQVPDLVADIIGDHAESNISNTIIPDLIASVTNDDTTNQDDKTDHIITNGPLMARKNLPDLVLADANSSRSKRKPRTVPGTRSFKTDDLNKPQNEFVASNKPCQIIPGTGHQDHSDKSEDQQNQWRLIGRDLAKIADSHSARHGGHSRMTRRRMSSSADVYVVESQLERVVGMNCLRRDNHHLHNRLCHHCQPQLRDSSRSISSQSLSVTITNIAINGLLYIVNNLL